MVGKKNKSGGKREGAGRPTLSQQFLKLAEDWDTEVGFSRPARDIAKKAKQLQRQIEARRVKIQSELEDLENVQRTREWRAVEYTDLPTV